MAGKKTFDKRIPIDDPRRSHGISRKTRGAMVGPDGEPRSENVPAGGNAPRHNKRRGRKHTKAAPRYWERNGERSAPPAGWVRGWK